mmetsp:Transcript_14720/g.21194  ORF Transcript_14720/g.21194 Transcript_14720/m.21194 type:complete len:231 (-) Transcript_14720:1653-2345(-)
MQAESSQCNALQTARIGGVAGTKIEQETMIEFFDSHADDTCVVSSDLCLITQDIERPVQVFAWDGTTKKGSTNKTVSAIVAYHQPTTGITHYLIFHQAICVDKVDAVLICPNQLRNKGLKVNDEPTSMVDSPTNRHHCIAIPRMDEEPVKITRMLKGVNSYFPARRPTHREYEEANKENDVDMTHEHVEWDPSDDCFEDQERAMLNHNYDLKEHYETRNVSLVQAETTLT